MKYNHIGLIWTTIHREDGSLFRNAADYFFDLEHPSDDYISMVTELMQCHVERYFPKYDTASNVWQVEFGGDGQDGLIDYALQSPPPSIPDMVFEVEGKKYTMVFNA